MTRLRPDLVMRCWLLLALLIWAIPSLAVQLPGSEQTVEEHWREAWGASSQWVNRLALSPSAYLRQHGDNPIDWHPWNEAALQQAQSENQLIFVSVGYASCHWCHVMERESFSDAGVAEQLNQHYLSIKVDREQQPDIDSWMSLVAESLQGEGGWPITVVLLPDLQPVFAAHYLDRDRLLTLLDRLQSQWSGNPQALEQQAGLLAAALPRVVQPDGGEAPPPLTEVLEQAVSALIADQDSQFGGFGQAEKFPHELKLQLLLNQYKVTSDERLKAVLETQLDAFMAGGLSDPVFGGVYRYTTDRSMTRPHFEKMLYNQALTARLFAEAALWLGQDRFRIYAEDVMAFTEGTLRLKDGRFASAVDAEHHGKEGGYYLFADHGETQAPDGVRAVAYANDEISFIGFPRDPSADAFHGWRQTLMAQRSSAPRITANAITAWNALLIRTQLALGQNEAAKALGDSLWTTAWANGRLQRMTGQSGYLEDYALLSQAYWELHARTLEPIWRSRARQLDQRMVEQFSHEQGWRSSSTASTPGAVLVSGVDTEVPSPLGAVIESLGRYLDRPAIMDTVTRAQRRALAETSASPEDHAALLTALSTPPRNWAIFAAGHGALRLVPGPSAESWGLELLLESPWHVNAHRITDENLIPTTLSAAFGDLDVRYPEGVPLVTDFAPEPLLVYGDRLSLPVVSTSNPVSPRLSLRTQACSDRICLLPETLSLTVLSTRIKEKMSD